MTAAVVEGERYGGYGGIDGGVGCGDYGVVDRNGGCAVVGVAVDGCDGEDGG
nr:hypothetical protein [Tanacetum cinerariifolium]